MESRMYRQPRIETLSAEAVLEALGPVSAGSGSKPNADQCIYPCTKPTAPK
jgi:hypothetical protein